MKGRFYIYLAVLSVLSPASCNLPELQKPNVLLIVSEDNGPDLECYGNPNVSTPHLDGLAKEGVLTPEEVENEVNSILGKEE